MAITHFGSVGVPVDGAAATNATTQITITPPGSMTTGDLVVVYVHQRGTATFSVGVTGGQTWNSLTRRTNTNIAVQGFWCRYNGTWGASPRFDLSAGTCSSAIMHVLRPTGTSYLWGVDQVEASAPFTAPSSPFTVSRTGVTNAQASAVALAGFFTADDNTWNTLAGAGWSQSGITAQYRNTSGTDQSSAFAYKIGTGATGNVSLNQATLGGDAGLTTIVSFYEYTANVYDDPLSEGITSGASELSAIVYPNTLSDGVTTGATESSIQTLIGSLSDAITAAASESSALESGNLLSESSTVGESAVGLIVSDNSLSDDAVLDSTLSGGILTDNEIGESALLDQSAVDQITSDNSLSQDAALDESVLAEMLTANEINESAGLDQIGEASQITGNSLSDDLTLSDSEVGGMVLAIGLSEEITPDQSHSYSAEFPNAIAEDSSLSFLTDGDIEIGVPEPPPSPPPTPPESPAIYEDILSESITLTQSIISPDYSMEMVCQIIDSDQISLTDSDSIGFDDAGCSVCEEDCYLTDSDGVIFSDLSSLLMDSGCAVDFSSDDFSSDFAICGDDEILNLKYWDGADWIGGRLKAWTGTQWKGTLKRYTVSGWV